MSLITAKALAHFAADGGRTCYEIDGAATPTMMFVPANGACLIVHPHPRLGERPPEAYAEFTYRFGKLYPWRYIGCAVEWMRNFPLEEQDEANRINKGDLARAAEAGDTRVSTAILGLGFDLEHRERSHTVLSRAIGEPPMVTWRTEEFPGVMDGHLPELILGAYDDAEVPDLPGTGLPPLQMLADVAVAADLVTGALVVGP